MRGSRCDDRNNPIRPGVWVWLRNWLRWWNLWQWVKRPVCCDNWNCIYGAQCIILYRKTALPSARLLAIQRSGLDGVYVNPSDILNEHLYFKCYTPLMGSVMDYHCIPLQGVMERSRKFLTKDNLGETTNMTRQPRNSVNNTASTCFQIVLLWISKKEGALSITMTRNLKTN